MRILLFSYRFYPFIGGIETVSRLVTNHFVNKGNEVIVITKTEGNEMDLPFRVLYNPSIPQIIKNIVWADVILENNPCLSLSWPLLFIPNKRVIAIHGPLQDENGRSNINQKIKKWWVKRANQALSCSQAINFAGEKINTIGNPYQEDVFRSYSNIKREEGFVFLGRLVSQKGGELMLNAFAHIPAHIRKKTTITLIGDGPEYEKLKNLTQQLNIEKYIFFKGQLTGEALARELHHYKYIVVPSICREAFGIVALEGMACGCIPVVADNCGLQEAIGKFGYTFKRGDTSSLTRIMTLLLSNRRNIALDRTEISNHLQQFSVASVCQKYMDAIIRAPAK